MSAIITSNKSIYFIVFIYNFIFINEKYTTNYFFTDFSNRRCWYGYSYLIIKRMVRIQTEILLGCGKLYKTFSINSGGDQPYIDIDYQLDWAKPMAGSLRLGYITINPEAFSQPNLFYATHNGGHEIEHFKMTKPINHGDAVSFLVSAKQALGCTDSIIELGDHKQHISVYPLFSHILLGRPKG